KCVWSSDVWSSNVEERRERGEERRTELHQGPDRDTGREGHVETMHLCMTLSGSFFLSPPLSLCPSPSTLSSLFLALSLSPFLPPSPSLSPSPSPSLSPS